MKYIALAILLTLTACKTVPSDPRQSPPPIAPLRQAVAATSAEIAGAQVQASGTRASLNQAQARITVIAREATPAQREEIERLSIDVESASMQIDTLTAHLLRAESAQRQSVVEIDLLETRIVSLVDQLNDAVVEKNQALQFLENEKAKLSVAIRQRNKLALYLTVLVGGALLIIFRRPLGAMLGIPIP